MSSSLSKPFAIPNDVFLSDKKFDAFMAEFDAKYPGPDGSPVYLHRPVPDEVFSNRVVFDAFLAAFDRQHKWKAGWPTLRSRLIDRFRQISVFTLPAKNRSFLEFVKKENIISYKGGTMDRFDNIEELFEVVEEDAYGFEIETEYMRGYVVSQYLKYKGGDGVEYAYEIYAV